MIPHRATRSRGFTLIEMSIVLVVIGLLVGGILAGKNIIVRSRLQAVITEWNDIRSSVSAFQLQYNSLPGDLLDAFDLWGAACGVDATHCNGDGNGTIDYNAAVAAIDNEPFRVWQHLSLANMVKGTYTAVQDVAGYPIIGTTYPATAYKSLDGNGEAGWSTIGGTMLSLGSVARIGNHTSQIRTYGDALSPMDAYSLDAKADDGIASTGDILGEAGMRQSGTVNPNCLVAAATDPSEYLLSNKGGGCTLRFSMF